MTTRTSATQVQLAAPHILRVGALTLKYVPRSLLICGILILAAIVLAIIGMGTGTIALSPQEVINSLIGTSTSARNDLVVERIRLPRVVTALMVGAALGAAGATFQSISRNALGSPDIIGFTTGAATGAVAQIVIFNAGPIATAAAAIVGGLLAAGVVYALSLSGGISGGYRLILVGIGVGSILGALNTILLAKGDSDLAAQAHLWLNGSLAARTWDHAAPMLTAVILLLPVLIYKTRDLNLMEMGDDSARALGVRVETTRLTTMTAAVGLTAVATAAAGPIAFVALAAPQLAARLTRAPGVPMLSAAITGAVLLLGADILTQHLPVDVAVPIGLMTGLIGGCYLLWLLTRSKQV